MRQNWSPDGSLAMWIRFDDDGFLVHATGAKPAFKDAKQRDMVVD
jgi:hypothetical protein